MLNFKEIDGIWFEEETDDQFAKFCINAMKNHKRVRITYKAGWEDFSGYHGGDGLHHTMYIGKSCGAKPCLLKISNKKSLGGEVLTTNRNAILNYGLK